MTTLKYLIAVPMLTLILWTMACSQGQQAITQPTATATPVSTPTLAPQNLTASAMVESLIACFERDEQMWNAYKDILRPTAQEMGMPDSFLDSLQPADIRPTLLGELEINPEARRPYIILLADCDARSGMMK